MTVEQREHPRAPLKLQVVYARHNSFVSGITHDLSKGGTFIETAEPLALRSELDFKLMLPDGQEPIILRGRVVWVSSPSRASCDLPAGMGIVFVWDDPEERDAFEARIAAVVGGHAEETKPSAEADA